MTTGEPLETGVAINVDWNQVHQDFLRNLPSLDRSVRDFVVAGVSQVVPKTLQGEMERRLPQADDKLNEIANQVGEALGLNSWEGNVFPKYFKAATQKLAHNPHSVIEILGSDSNDGSVGQSLTAEFQAQDVKDLLQVGIEKPQAKNYLGRLVIAASTLVAALLQQDFDNQSFKEKLQYQKKIISGTRTVIKRSSSS